MKGWLKVKGDSALEINSGAFSGVHPENNIKLCSALTVENSEFTCSKQRPNSFIKDQNITNETEEKVFILAKSPKPRARSLFKQLNSGLCPLLVGRSGDLTMVLLR